MAEPQRPDALPDRLEKVRQTQVFDEHTIPAPLLKDHKTAEQTWALIHMVSGRLRYRITDPRRDPQERILTPDAEPGLIEPTILHHVEPLGTVRFFLEFHRAVAEPIALCRHEELARRENEVRPGLQERAGGEAVNRLPADGVPRIDARED